MTNILNIIQWRTIHSWSFHRASAALASASTTMKPALWRVPSYSAPTLPSPTIRYLATGSSVVPLQSFCFQMDISLSSSPIHSVLNCKDTTFLYYTRTKLLQGENQSAQPREKQHPHFRATERGCPHCTAYFERWFFNQTLTSVHNAHSLHRQLLHGGAQRRGDAHYVNALGQAREVQHAGLRHAAPAPARRILFISVNTYKRRLFAKKQYIVLYRCILLFLQTYTYFQFFARRKQKNVNCRACRHRAGTEPLRSPYGPPTAFH